VKFVASVARGVLILGGAFIVAYMVFSTIAGPEALPDFLQPPVMPWEKK
jgi:hypothetical protein